ncbi:MAG: TRAP transporter small permease [Roseateles asaccharophilus]|jgi:TRAP-type C4-dicarboxylate transport system permease small subunit|uniref:TRAP transporter small permease protein n=1 Tax=Roseateles asaccharophilus TaxID=582607 RepID=A0A4R6N3E1_9BURK|nr:TRAP transporter small permease subunit [Roseateles asaccharophilus]MDN3544574.1 TRAP transporter small permease subunit [Roseateles asaccharophilus]TDP09660.1 TRAP-type C4-dicarboxylate transport system permease small subunit [Roseateles asaccharophilus]
MSETLRKCTDALMAACLAVMALAVFVNVVLRYGFGSGIAASEELSRLLFVWMVFVGATAAYPRGEHMAFTSLLLPLRSKPRALQAMTVLIRLSVITACVLLAWGAWQQVVVGMDSHSVVLGYPMALLPLPALLCAVAIALMALWQLIRGEALDLGHEVDVE